MKIRFLVMAVLVLAFDAGLRAQMSTLDKWAISQPGLFGDVVAGRFELIREDTETRRGLASILDALSAHRCALSPAEQLRLDADASDIAAITRYLFNSGGQFDWAVGLPRATHPEFVRTATYIKDTGCEHATVRLLVVNFYKLLIHRASGTPLPSVRREATRLEGWTAGVSSDSFGAYLKAMHEQGLDWKPLNDQIEQLRASGYSVIGCGYGIDGISRDSQELTSFRFWHKQSPVGDLIRFPVVEGTERTPLFTTVALEHCPPTLAEATEIASAAVKNADVVGPPAQRRDLSKDPPIWQGTWTGVAERPYYKTPVVLTLTVQDGVPTAHFESSSENLRGPMQMNLEFRGETITFRATPHISFTGRVTAENTLEGVLSVWTWNTEPIALTLVKRR